MRVLFTTAVWGKDYVDRFIQYSLPSQLAPGNIDAAGPTSLYILYTLEENVSFFESHPTFCALRAVVQTEIVPIHPSLFNSAGATKYTVLTATQNDALARSQQFDVIFFGYADMIWSEGAYEVALQRIAEGYTAVFSHGYPVIDEDFRQFLDERRVRALPHSLSVSTESLSRGVLGHLHPYAESNYWSNQWLGRAPAYLFWSVVGQGVVTRAFHLHPVAVSVQHDYPEFFGSFRSTLDEEFCSRLARVPSRLYISRNSREICCCSLFVAGWTDHRLQPPRRPNVFDVAGFAEGHAGLVHRLLARVPIRLVGDYTDENAWRTAEEEAEDVLRQVFELLATPDEMLAIECPRVFERRLYRRHLFAAAHEMRRPTERLQKAVMPNHLLREFCEKNGFSCRVMICRLLIARLRLKLFRLVYRQQLTEPLALMITEQNDHGRGGRMLVSYRPVSQRKADNALVDVSSLERVPTVSLVSEILVQVTGLQWAWRAARKMLRRSAA